MRISPVLLLRTGGLGVGLVGAILLPFGLGITFLLTDSQRYESPTFEVAKTLTRGLPWLTPMAWWGVLMLLGVIHLSFGVFTGHLGMLRIALVIGCGFWAFWGVQYLIAGLSNPGASLTAPWVYLMITLSYLALAQGVAKAPGR